jgi:hypothetical protein
MLLLNNFLNLSKTLNFFNFSFLKSTYIFMIRRGNIFKSLSQTLIFNILIMIFMIKYFWINFRVLNRQDFEFIQIKLTKTSYINRTLIAVYAGFNFQF